MKAPAYVKKLKNYRKYCYECTNIISLNLRAWEKERFYEKLPWGGFPKFNIIGKKWLETV